MDAIKDLTVDEKIHFSEQPNDIANIICRAIFGECTNKRIEHGQSIEKLIEKSKLLVLSSIGKENCTLAYKKHLLGDCSFYLLEHLDFEESNLEKDAVYRLTFYNLELFRRKSVRAKSKFISSTRVDQIEKENYIKIIDKKLIDKFPSWYLDLYRIIAYESEASLRQIFCELNECEKDEFSDLIDSIIPLTFYTGSPISFCNTLINYYLEIDYTNNVNKFSIFLLLTKFYEKIDRATIQKINSNSVPLVCYCLSDDKNGEYLEMLEKFIEGLPTVSKNLHIILIVTYAKIFQNETYDRFFCNKIDQPTNKYERIYCEVLQKVEILQKQNKLHGLAPLELKKGVDEYRMFLQDDFHPKQPSTFFNLLRSDS